MSTTDRAARAAATPIIIVAVVITAMVAATDTAITNGVVDTIRGGAIHVMPITAIGIMGRGATGGTDITSYLLF